MHSREIVGQGEDGEAGGKKKGGGKKGGVQEEEDPNQPDFSKIELKVGKIVKVNGWMNR